MFENFRIIVQVNTILRENALTYKTILTLKPRIEQSVSTYNKKGIRFMKNNTIIRLMTSVDKEAVLDMMRIFYASPAVLSNGSDTIFTNDIENCINDCPYLEGYIFENEIEIQGYAMTAKSFSTEFGKPCIWIEDLYLKPEYRGLGIASEFFKFIEAKYPNSIFRLEAETENEHAVRVYKTCGYEILPYLELIKNK